MPEMQECQENTAMPPSPTLHRIRISRVGLCCDMLFETPTLNLGIVDSWIAFQRFHKNVSYLEQELFRWIGWNTSWALGQHLMLLTPSRITCGSSLLTPTNIRLLTTRRECCTMALSTFSTSPFKKKKSDHDEWHSTRILQGIPTILVGILFTSGRDLGNAVPSAN